MLRDVHGKTVIDYIIQKKYYCLLNEELDKAGNTALMYVAKNGLIKDAKKLLNLEVDYTRKNANNETAYQIAIKNKHKHTARAIRKSLKGLVYFKIPYTIMKDALARKYRIEKVKEEIPIYTTRPEQYFERRCATIMTPNGAQMVYADEVKMREVKEIDYYKTEYVDKEVPYLEAEKDHFKNFNGKKTCSTSRSAF